MNSENKHESLKDDFIEDDFFINKLVNFLPDNIFQETTSLIRNLIDSNFNIEKAFECEFKCLNGGK